MCFSANASFGASALLAGIGIISIVKARTVPQRLFAATPILFSIQQLAEGMLWLSLRQPALENWQPVFTYIFLVFAMAAWPFWIPFTIWKLEKDKQRKKILSILTLLGSLLSIVVGCVLLFFPVKVMASHHHLHYSFTFPQVAKNMIWLFTLLYIFSTIIAPFISGSKRMKWLGIIYLASYLFSVIFYNGFVISVWCYFAAVLSIIVLWIIMELRKSRY